VCWVRSRTRAACCVAMLMTPWVTASATDVEGRCSDAVAPVRLDRPFWTEETAGRGGCHTPRTTSNGHTDRSVAVLLTFLGFRSSDFSCCFLGWELSRQHNHLHGLRHCFSLFSGCFFSYHGISAAGSSNCVYCNWLLSAWTPAWR